MRKPDKVNRENNAKESLHCVCVCQSKDVWSRTSGVEKYVIFPFDPESVIVNERVIDPSPLSILLASLYLYQE